VCVSLESPPPSQRRCDCEGTKTAAVAMVAHPRRPPGPFSAALQKKMVKRTEQGILRHGCRMNDDDEMKGQMDTEMMMRVFQHRVAIVIGGGSPAHSGIG
jgi:hypothetical protein